MPMKSWNFGESDPAQVQETTQFTDTTGCAGLVSNGGLYIAGATTLARFNLADMALHETPAVVAGGGSVFTSLLRRATIDDQIYGLNGFESGPSGLFSVDETALPAISTNPVVGADRGAWWNVLGSGFAGEIQGNANRVWVPGFAASGNGLLGPGFSTSSVPYTEINGIVVGIYPNPPSIRLCAWNVSDALAAPSVLVTNSGIPAPTGGVTGKNRNRVAAVPLLNRVYWTQPEFSYLFRADVVVPSLETMAIAGPCTGGLLAIPERDMLLVASTSSILFYHISSETLFYTLPLTSVYGALTELPEIAPINNRGAWVVSRATRSAIRIQF